MFTFVVLLKIFSHNFSSATTTYNVCKWLTLLFVCLNLALFFFAVAGDNRIGGCEKGMPMSLGGLGFKLLLILFDVSVFIGHCFDWGIKKNEQAKEGEGSVEMFR